jgi:hypothetical protein
MLSAGIYKLTAGYPQDEGMDYGLVNPQWGYWWRWYRQLPPGHWLFRTLNHLAWSTEVVAAILMLVPQTRFLGSLMILASFVFIASQIRLGFLCEMVIVGAMFFFHEGSLGAHLFASAVDPAPAVAAGNYHLLASSALWTYLLLLPVAHAGLFYNFYGRRRLPGALQHLLEFYTNLTGTIIWRVFSVDVVNFYVLISRQPRGDASARSLVSHYGWRGGFRYSHVAESIAVTSLFTTLKYYPSNSALFIERLLRYARTVPRSIDEDVIFEYVSISKDRVRFTTRVVAEYVVDVDAGTVTEHLLDPDAAIRSSHPVSPVHEGMRPGSYAPIRA